MGICGSVMVCAALVFSSRSVLASASAAVVQMPVQRRPDSDVAFPITVPGTTLNVLKLMAYEGPFLEDGSDREVVDIAALLVCNRGDEMILRAQVELICGEKIYQFYGERIVPGVPLLLLEQNGAKYENGGVYACSGWQTTTICREYLDKEITVADEQMGTIIVTNHTTDTLEDVTIYYRSWLNPPGFFIGGIVYNVTVPILEPGQTVRLYPYHYAKGYSKPVSVTVGNVQLTNEPAAN